MATLSSRFTSTANVLSIRRSLALALPLAILAGIIAGPGVPGSALAFIPLAIFLALIWHQSRKGWTPWTAATAALALMPCAAMALEPGFLNTAMAWLGLGFFGLAGAAEKGGSLDAALKGLSRQLLGSPLRVIADARFLRRAAKRNPQAWKPAVNWRPLAVPVLAVLVFPLLLISANPVLESFVNRLLPGMPPIAPGFWTLPTSALTLCMAWVILRQRKILAEGPEAAAAPHWHRLYFSPFTIITTLLALNFLFAIENALDLRYLWSGEALPPGMNYAEYVHRGAYTLVATALFAAALMVVALWPGSRTAQSPAVRGLVYAWILQNVFLVASSAARTVDYVSAYGLTELRLAGLVWMGLVAIGLQLIGIRIFSARGNRWLISSNLAAAFAVLLAWCFIDPAALVARYNVNRAIASIEDNAQYHGVTGLITSQAVVDLNYLCELGPSALPAFRLLNARAQDYRIQLTVPSSGESWAGPPCGDTSRTGDAAAILPDYIARLTADLARQQADWRSWTLRGWLLPQS